MTPRQVKKALDSAKIDLGGVEITTKEVSIYCVTKAGEFSRKLTRQKARQIKQVIKWGGYTCASGQVVLASDYVPMGDPGDKSSRWHY